MAKVFESGFTASQLAARAKKGFEKGEHDLADLYRTTFLLARDVRKYGDEALDAEIVGRIDELGSRIETEAHKLLAVSRKAVEAAEIEGNWSVLHEMTGSALKGSGERGLVDMLDARRALATQAVGYVGEMREAKSEQEREAAARKIINATIRLANETVDQGSFSGLNAQECAVMGTWFANSVTLTNETIARRSVAEEVTPRYILARLDIARTGQEFSENRDIARYLREVRGIVENDFAAELMGKADKMTLDTISTTFSILKSRIEAAEAQIALGRGVDMPSVHNWQQLILRLPENRPFDHRRFERQVTAAMSEALIAAVGGEHAYGIVSNFEAKKDAYARKLEKVLDGRAEARTARDQIAMTYSDAEGKLAALHPTAVVHALSSSQVEAVSRELPLKTSKSIDSKVSKEIMIHGLEVVAKTMGSEKKSTSKGMDI